MSWVPFLLTHDQLDPYTNVHNSVVMSPNGAKPMYYEGWQQSDVVRIKALERLRQLTAVEDHDPFFLMIAPTAPHVQPSAMPPAPPARYVDQYANLSLPHRPNFNPSDVEHQNRPSWWADLPRLNDTQLAEVDLLYRRRSESLLGVDDIITDVVALLEEKGELDNTYLIFSSDQGYHLGTHRDIGKCSPYIEDANIPLVVRGPRIPRGAISAVRSTVIDFAPTFLDITGLTGEDRPPFFDGTSMLPVWTSLSDSSLAKANEAINVEFWGRAYTELPTWTGGDGGPRVYKNNTYKTMRIVGEGYAWVYSRWCTGDTELYDSNNDPFEMNNLGGSTDVHLTRVKSRLNALLMVMKSCEAEVCRDPWRELQPPVGDAGGRDDEQFRLTARSINNFADSLNPDFDAFFASIPTVSIAECYQYQYAPNERPFYPSQAETGLGLEHRSEPSFFEYPDVKPVARVPYKVGGGWEQRDATFEMLMADARELMTNELGQDWDSTTCNEGQKCRVDPRSLVDSELGVRLPHPEL